MDKWITLADLNRYQEVDKVEIKAAMGKAVKQVERNLPEFTEQFPGANSFELFYKPGPNVDWTTGFWTVIRISQPMTWWTISGLQLWPTAAILPGMWMASRSRGRSRPARPE